jgi:hypothetical protein
MLLARLSGTAKEFLDSEIKSVVLPELRNTLLTAGIDLNNDPNAKFLICVNHNKQAYKEFIKNGGRVKNAILIRLEPDAVYPKQYQPKVESKYGLIISPGSVHNISKFFGWPYKYHLNPAKPGDSDPSLLEILDSNRTSSLFTYGNWIKREHLLTMVASNRVSPVRSANYALRRALAKTLPISTLSVYGPLWNDSSGIKILHRIAILVWALKQGTFPNLHQIYGNLFTKYSTTKGPILDKHELLRQSKFSLVIENSNQTVTEKIFDSLINGTIPIYVGANLQLANIPADLAFPIKGSEDEIIEIIKNHSKAEIVQKLDAISKYLSSENFFKHWLHSNVYVSIGLEISQYIYRNTKD